MLAAQAVSSSGSMMQSAALHWHLYELTRNPLALGMLGLFRVIPILLFSLLGGAIADSVDRRRILLVTQSVLACVAAGLYFTTVSRTIQAPIIYLFTFVSGAALAFDNPARQSLLPNLVPREHFSNAASLNSLAFRLSTIVGPALAGWLIARGSLAMAYGLNAVSFIAMLAALGSMFSLLPPHVRREDTRPSLRSLKEGLQFVRSTPILVATMLLDFVATFFSSADLLLPAIARDILHVGAQQYGLLASAQAAGSLLVGVILTARPPIVRQGMTLVAAVLVYGAATALLGISRWFILSWVLLACIGASDTVSTVLRQTIRQLVTPDHLRGRMVSVNMIFFMGGPQLGELEAGLVAKWLGVPFSIVSGGVVCILAAAVVVQRMPWLVHYRLSSHNPQNS
jgi:MFS family permease